MQNKHENIYRNKILQYFLNLYKFQEKADLRCPHEVMEIDSIRGNKDRIFEFRIRKKEKVKSARITIGILGETSGSKSLCFKVIFKDVIVVKIPPSPLTSLTDYLESIEGERRIAQSLSGHVHCIAPDLSTILKRLPMFSDMTRLDPDQFEQMCRNNLKQYPELQKHLKIGETFVFFMDLSRYIFLGQVIEKIHDTSKLVKEEILTQTEILWDPMLFEEKYSGRHLDLLKEIQSIYTEYKKTAKGLFSRYGVSPSRQKTREWFVTHIADEEITHIDGTSNKTGNIKAINNILKEVIRKHEKTASEYRKITLDMASRKRFEQSKEQITAIIENVLLLLSCLRDLKIAVRDLKPDNIFLTVEPEELISTSRSKNHLFIGMIDFETSVSFDKEKKDKIPQPLMAGTPFYATPSHLFNNRLLSHIYSNLPRIFHIQDWQAVVGIIYNVSTGQRLVEKTAKFFPEIIRVKAQSGKSDIPQDTIFREGSKQFWSRAVDEFNAKIGKDREKLMSIVFKIPAPAIPMMEEEINRDMDYILTLITNRINNQLFFKSSKSRKNLLSASYKSIQQCRNNWENEIGIPKVKPKVKQRVVNFLNEIEQLKKQVEKRKYVLSILESQSPQISAYVLLESMFYIVYHTMYPQQWDRMLTENGGKPAKNIDGMGEDTISSLHPDSFEKTIAAVMDDGNDN